MSVIRFYNCPKCGWLLVTSSAGGPMPHDCKDAEDLEKIDPAYIL